MQVLNITGYLFVSLSDLEDLRDSLLKKCQEFALKGTILLSPEGININLTGKYDDIKCFKKFLWQIECFSTLSFRESYSSSYPFKQMKVKIKKEIITFHCPDIRPDKTTRAPSISPQNLKQWLDENRDITLLDTRNNYEIKLGTFQGAMNLQIEDFSAFANAAKIIPGNKPVVMFCTGGIRCEKAAIQLLNTGFAEVYQLEGGILNYFTEVGGKHYNGMCFVFDERIAVDANLKEATPL